MDGKSMFGDLKSKLGIGRKDDFDEFYDDYEEFDDSDGFDDYGEYGYDESYTRSSGSRDRYSDRYSSVTTREPGDRGRGRSTMPRLVSIDDVRARTQVPSLPDDSVSAFRRSSSRTSASGSYRTMVDSSLPPQMTPEGTAAASAAATVVHRDRSEGLSSLFEPTSSESSSLRGPALAASFTPARNLKVVAPQAYNDAEEVSTALKLGNAIILNLAATPDALAKRILDFSFGVASALDANVECVGNKVFALTRVGELSEAERSYLHTQGIV